MTFAGRPEIFTLYFAPSLNGNFFGHLISAVLRGHLAIANFPPRQFSRIVNFAFFGDFTRQNRALPACTQ